MPLCYPMRRLFRTITRRIQMQHHFGSIDSKKDELHVSSLRYEITDTPRVLFTRSSFSLPISSHYNHHIAFLADFLRFLGTLCLRGRTVFCYQKDTDGDLRNRKHGPCSPSRISLPCRSTRHASSFHNPTSLATGSSVCSRSVAHVPCQAPTLFPSTSRLLLVRHAKKVGPRKRGLRYACRV